MWSKAAIAYLDQWFPERGPCAFCGHKDARHRLWDTIIDSTDPDIMEAHNCDFQDVDAIRAVRQIRPYRRGGKLPGRDHLAIHS